MLIEADGATLNVAVTVVSEFMVTTQESVPEQTPLQPAKSDPDSAEAASVTNEPSVYSSVQSPESAGGRLQLMPSPLTEPPPLPTVCTVSVLVCAKTERVGTTASANTSSEMIRNGNIRRTRRCPKTPQADLEEPTNISQFGREATTLNTGKPRIPYITLAPSQGGVALIRV